MTEKDVADGLRAMGNIIVALVMLCLIGAGTILYGAWKLALWMF